MLVFHVVVVFLSRNPTSRHPTVPDARLSTRTPSFPSSLAPFLDRVAGLRKILLKWTRRNSLFHSILSVSTHTQCR